MMRGDNAARSNGRMKTNELHHQLSGAVQRAGIAS
jgi:hypothetical protein